MVKPVSSNAQAIVGSKNISRSKEAIIRALEERLKVAIRDNNAEEAQRIEQRLGLLNSKQVGRV